MDNDNKNRSSRIARNTLYLYGQMLVQLVVSLFTARVVILTLGDIDYGIFTVVGGVMSVFIVLNSLVSATMRFITYAQGEGKSVEELHTIFSTARLVHLTIAGLVFLSAETFGLYYVCNYLVVPPDRLTATIIIYQFSIITSLIGIMSAPYDALIVAHERMGVFASIGIYNVIINLVIVFLVKYIDTDKLILYAALIMLVQVSMRLIYGWYCNRSFPETHGRWVFDKQLFIRMLKFGGWSFNGTLASIGYSQGINLLLNYFFNAVMNTAYGVATLVQSKIYQFADNILTAVQPQIVKSYAAGDYTFLHTLVITSSKFAFLLLYILSLPVLLNTYYILYIYLGDVPEYTVWFVRMSLMSMMVHTLGAVMCMSIHATGRIAKFQMVEANLLLLIVPIAWFCLWKGCSPVSVFIVQLFVFIVTQIARMLIVCPAIKLSIWRYTKEVLLKCLIVVIIGSILPVIAHLSNYLIDYPLTKIIINTSICLVSTLPTIYYIGLDKEQRKFVVAKVKKIFRPL